MNVFIGTKLREIREKNQLLPTTDYMKHALELWKKLSDKEKKAIVIE
jgi:hypothetical protein